MGDPLDFLDECPKPPRGYSKARSPWEEPKSKLNCGLVDFLVMTGQKWVSAFLDGQGDMISWVMHIERRYRGK